MQSEKSEAIVLRFVPWSESSLIVTLLTRDFGKISAVAKGARRLKSPFDGALDLLSICEVVFINKSGEVLDILTESKLTTRFRIAQRDLNALHCGYYLADLLNSLTESDHGLSELYDAAKSTIRKIDAGLPPLSSVIQFELTLMKLLGHAPELKNCVGCGVELPSDLTLPFAIYEGGLVCQACLPGKRHVLRLKSDVNLYLQHAIGSDCCSGDVPLLPTDRRGEIRQLINGLITQLNERPIRLAHLLDTVPN
jgi:DNA repair protein RecO (recombination protein O)